MFIEAQAKVKIFDKLKASLVEYKLHNALDIIIFKSQSILLKKQEMKTNGI